MKYYIAADGGGTKLQAVLYDENMNIVNNVRTYGINTYFKPVDLIEKDICKLVSELIPHYVKEIERIDTSVLNSEDILFNAIKSRCHIKKRCIHTEGHTALAAAGARYGIAAQSGTGSDAILVFENGKDYDYVGGWGALLGDEGSGYDIGIKSLKAAIYAYDGRGPETLMLDMIMDKWQLGELCEMIGKLANSPEYRRMVAKVTYITSEAAKRGDKAALEIYTQAAHDMSLQVHAIIKRYNGWEGPIVVSGGTWKGCKKMFEIFCSDIWKSYPKAEIKRAAFEPVVGCIILKCFDEGKEFSEIEQILNENYKEFKL